jgi:hypothetical protein
MLLIKKYMASFFELSVWVTGLIYLALINPAEQIHFSICIFKWMGFSFCPGCGLGHSVSWLFHGDFIQSFQAHPLGVFAVAILLFRIFTLTKNSFDHFFILKKQS